MKKLIMMVVAMTAVVAWADTVSFSYQGALKTATGDNIPPEQSNKTISFRLYDTPTGSEAIWGRALAVHLDANGLFNVELSDTAGSQVSGSVKTNELAAVLSQYPTLYIGLDVDGSTGEIRPRQKLLNVPTAAFAADVSTAKADFTVEGTATFRGAAVANSTMTAKGMLTAENGMTVNNGGLTLSKGNLSVKNGGLSVSGGGLSIGSGITIDPAGDTGKGIIPRGVITMWHGDVNKIPAGWALCDGSNDTPDLRGRFIVGASRAAGQYGAGADQSYTAGNTGGESRHKLTANELPVHTHPFTIGTHVVFAYKPDDHNSQKGYIYAETGYEADRRVKDFTHAEKNQTSENAHENRPQYYALCFIMKL